MFGTVEALDPLVIDEHPLSLQQRVQSAVAKPGPLCSQRSQPGTQPRLISALAAVIPGRRASEPDQPTGPALRQLEVLLDIADRCPLRGGLQKFFWSSSLSTWLASA